MVIDPTIALEKEKVYVTVELKGQHSRGMMVVDRKCFLGRPPNAFIVKNMDLSKTQALFGAVFCGQQEVTTESICLPVSTVAAPNTVPILYREVRVLPVNAVISWEDNSSDVFNLQHFFKKKLYYKLYFQYWWGHPYICS